MQRLQEIFDEVKAFVCLKYPKYADFRLNVGCPEAERIRVEDADGGRVYMHTCHHDDTVCASVEACNLPDCNLYGLFLHEFGHHIGGEEQWQADYSVYENFGIKLYYDKRAVEYISLYDMLKVNSYAQIPYLSKDARHGLTMHSVTPHGWLNNPYDANPAEYLMDDDVRDSLNNMLHNLCLKDHGELPQLPLGEIDFAFGIHNLKRFAPYATEVMREKTPIRGRDGEVLEQISQDGSPLGNYFHMLWYRTPNGKYRILAYIS